MHGQPGIAAEREPSRVFGTRDAFLANMIRHSSPRFDRASVQPLPLVKIDARRHVPLDPVRTRLGVGVGFIDHAAGAPLRARDSYPPPAAAYEPAPVYEPVPSRSAQSRAWNEQAPAWEDRSTPLEGMARPSQAPVNLPLQSRGKTIALAVGLFVAFAAICISIIATGISSTVSLPVSTGPGAQPATHANAPAAPATDSTSATSLPAAGFGAGAPKIVTPGAPRRSDIVEKH
jgi:hypothetical protein